MTSFNVFTKKVDILRSKFKSNDCLTPSKYWFSCDLTFTIKSDLYFEGRVLMDLRELGSIILVKVFCFIKIPKSPNFLLWIIENSNFLIFSIMLL